MSALVQCAPDLSRKQDIRLFIVELLVSCQFHGSVRETILPSVSATSLPSFHGLTDSRCQEVCHSNVFIQLSIITNTVWLHTSTATWC